MRKYSLLPDSRAEDPLWFKSSRPRRELTTYQLVFSVSHCFIRNVDRALQQLIQYALSRTLLMNGVKNLSGKQRIAKSDSVMGQRYAASELADGQMLK